MYMAQLMPMPLTVSCFSKVQIGFTFLVPAHPGSPGKRAVKRVCVSVLLAGAVLPCSRYSQGDDEDVVGDGKLTEAGKCRDEAEDSVRHGQ